MKYLGNLIDLITEIEVKTNANVRHFKQAKERFIKRQVRSINQVLNEYARLSINDRFVALCLFMHYRYKKALPILFREITGPNAQLAGAAGGALAMIGGTWVVRRLVRLLRKPRVYKHRITLVGALAMAVDVKEPATIKLRVEYLLDVLKDVSEPVMCRMSAAEGIANSLKNAGKGSKLYQNGLNGLLNALDDCSPDVRAASVFALGELHADESLRKLTELSQTDHKERCLYSGIGPTWTVSKEAIAAINKINEKDRKNRKKRRKGFSAVKKRGEAGT